MDVIEVAVILLVQPPTTDFDQFICDYFDLNPSGTIHNGQDGGQDVLIDGSAPLGGSGSRTEAVLDLIKGLRGIGAEVFDILPPVDDVSSVAIFCGTDEDTVMEWATDPTFPEPAEREGQKALYDIGEVQRWLAEYHPGLENLDLVHMNERERRQVLRTIHRGNI